MVFKALDNYKQNVLRWLFCHYVKVETYISQYLPKEKKVYVIRNNELKNITIKYYICLLLNLIFTNHMEDYLIEYRHQNKKKLILRGNYLDIISKTRRDSSPLLRVPLYGFVVVANDKVLGYEDKKKLMIHDRDDKVYILYSLYFNETLHRLVVENKSKRMVWEGDECLGITIRDMLS